SLSFMVTNIFCLTQIDQQILITIEKQDILALQKRDTLPWGLQSLCVLSPLCSIARVSTILSQTKKSKYNTAPACTPIVDHFTNILHG
ncbi:hypothetical protein, partial [Photobacterium carnosum]|uniref:hypothetical protein n=1 Tax=Photobacterium carnosum TaxID=2023717 RepID=UPI001C8FD853